MKTPSPTDPDVPQQVLDPCHLGRPVHLLPVFTAALRDDIAELFRTGMNRRYRASFEVGEATMTCPDAPEHTGRWRSFSCAVGRIGFAIDRGVLLAALNYRYGSREAVPAAPRKAVPADSHDDAPADSHDTSPADSHQAAQAASNQAAPASAAEVAPGGSAEAAPGGSAEAAPGASSEAAPGAASEAAPTDSHASAATAAPASPVVAELLVPETSTEDRLAAMLGLQFVAVLAACIDAGSTASPTFAPAVVCLPPGHRVWTIRLAVKEPTLGIEGPLWFTLDDAWMLRLFQRLVADRPRVREARGDPKPLAARLQLKLTGRLLHCEVPLGELIGVQVGDVIPVRIGPTEVLIDDSPLLRAVIAERDGKLCLTSFEDLE